MKNLKSTIVFGAIAYTLIFMMDLMSKTEMDSPTLKNISTIDEYYNQQENFEKDYVKGRIEMRLRESHRILTGRDLVVNLNQ